jgi:hypothetical protein
MLVTNVRIKFYAKDIATVDCEHTISRFDDGKHYLPRRLRSFHYEKSERPMAHRSPARSAERSAW